MRALLADRFSGLWQQPDFVRFWSAQTISVFGSQVTGMAVPLTAVLLLEASPFEMGVLAAADDIAFLLLSLFAGVWVDRLRRRPILVGADLGRALLLGSIPLAALLGVLRMEQLYVVAFLAGVLTVFFQVANQSFLPVLVGREHLVEGNSKLEVSRSVAQIAGPGVAGALVQAVTAPLAILLDAVSFVVSALLLGLVRTPEPPPATPAQRRSIWAEIGEGLQVVLRSHILRTIAGCTATFNFSAGALFAVFLLYVTRDVGIEPLLLGLIFTAGSVGGLVGAVTASWVARRLGLGPAIVGGALLGGIGSLFIPLVTGPVVVAVPLLILSQLLFGLGIPIYNINQVSLRQAITPDRLQGRMNASMRFIVTGIGPLGALAGGALGELIGLRPTLLVGALGMSVAFLWVFLSPVRSLKEQPQPFRDSEPAGAPA